MRNLELLVVSLEYIEEHLGDDIRTEDLAEACFCSKSTLEKMYRCVCHISVHDYVVRRRMMRAARDLTKLPPVSILDIAMEYGYSTHESFARAFEQIWNCKPSEFRNRKYSEIFPRFRVNLENGGDYSMGTKNVDISELYDLFKERRNCYFICCDIRKMMKINEISHKAGDMAILETVRRMEEAVGEEDMVFRIGGDEFCILTDSSEESYACEIAEKIKDRNGEEFSYREEKIPLTLHTAVISLERPYVNDSDLFMDLHEAMCNAIRGGVKEDGERN